jgi:hypothetical protein
MIGVSSDSNNMLALQNVAVFGLPLTANEFLLWEYTRKINVDQYEGSLLVYYDFETPFHLNLYDQSIYS